MDITKGWGSEPLLDRVIDDIGIQPGVVRTRKFNLFILYLLKTTFDDDGDGYTESEGIVMIMIRIETLAKLKYVMRKIMTVMALWMKDVQFCQQGLVAYWPFNGNANDASGNANHGTTHGTVPTTDRFGIANSAYLFAGNDYN
ncbi:MAG: hypothetical protein R2861_04795 [Desulfobacterales bacterium]